MSLAPPSPSTRPGARGFSFPKEGGLVVGILSMLTVIFLIEPNHSFFSSYSLRTVIHQIALFGGLALGAAIVIIAGGIDLSVGSVVALASVVSAKLVTEWLPGASSGATPPSAGVVGVAIVLTLLMGLCVGLLHAWLINQLGLPPFIATLATMSGLRSLATLISKNKSINVSFDAYRLLGSDPWYTVPIFVCLAIAASIMMSSTVLGRHLYALGGNEAAARLSGLSTKRLKAVAYIISSMLASLAGILFTGKSGQGSSTMGVSYELYAITAAVVGGCSLAGGVGSIRGTVLGLILIQVVIKGTGLATPRDWGVDSTQIEGLVLGLVVITAVAINQGKIPWLNFGRWFRGRQATGGTG
jgi:ribose/xylose/arabinose/galactoside ABC-type transport system permease subunit